MNWRNSIAILVLGLSATTFAQSNLLNAKTPDQIGKKTEAELSADNDKPLEVAPATDSFSPEVQTDLACIDIIGGADEPTIILCGNNNQANLHVAYSALHFKPVSDDIEWRIEFNIIRFSKKTFLLI